jgi:hypothetical protein
VLGKGLMGDKTEGNKDEDKSERAELPWEES